MIIGHGLWLKHIQRMGIFVDQLKFKGADSRKKQLNISCLIKEPWNREDLLRFVWSQRTEAFLQENMAGVILRYNRLMALSAVQS